MLLGYSGCGLSAEEIACKSIGLAENLLEDMFCETAHCHAQWKKVHATTDAACGIARSELCNARNCPENYYNSHCKKLRRGWIKRPNLVFSFP